MKSPRAVNAMQDRLATVRKLRTILAGWLASTHTQRLVGEQARAIATLRARLEQALERYKDLSAPARLGRSSLAAGDVERLISRLASEMSARRAADEEVERRTAQLRSLAAQLAEAEDRERHHIASVLHDEVGQLLACSRLVLGKVASQSSPSVTDDVDTVCSMLEDAMQHTRSLTSELGSPSAGELSLREALDRLGEWLLDHHSLAVEVIELAPVPDVDCQLRSTLFAAARELLYNVVKHASAERATVTIEQADHELRITVVDDGVGFDPSDDTAHSGAGVGYGLASIRERLSPFHGGIEIESEPGRGTRVCLRAPCQAIVRT